MGASRVTGSLTHLGSQISTHKCKHGPKFSTLDCIEMKKNSTQLCSAPRSKCKLLLPDAHPPAPCGVHCMLCSTMPLEEGTGRIIPSVMSFSLLETRDLFRLNLYIYQGWLTRTHQFEFQIYPKSHCLAVNWIICEHCHKLFSFTSKGKYTVLSCWEDTQKRMLLSE